MPTSVSAGADSESPSAELLFIRQTQQGSLSSAPGQSQSFAALLLVLAFG